MRPAANTKPNSDARPVKERLLDTAERLFHEEGIHVVGIDRVLEESGAAKASLYHHFGSKDGLIQAYLERKRDLFMDHLAAVLNPFADDPKKALVALFEDACAYSSDPAFRGCPFQIAGAELSGCGHASCSIIRDQESSFNQLLTSLCRDAGALEPEKAADALQMLYQGILSAHGAHGRRSSGAATWAARQIIDSMSSER